MYRLNGLLSVQLGSIDGLLNRLLGFDGNVIIVSSCYLFVSES